jgi:hypothetical protein
VKHDVKHDVMTHEVLGYAHIMGIHVPMTIWGSPRSKVMDWHVVYAARSLAIVRTLVGLGYIIPVHRAFRACLNIWYVFQDV